MPKRQDFLYAIELYLQACKISPDNVRARRELRAVENRMAKENGVSFWNKTKAAGMQTQAHALLLAKKYDAAIEKAEEALKSDPENVGLLMILGRAAFAAGYTNTAICTFEDIKNVRGGGNAQLLIEALRELAVAYESVGRTKEATDIRRTLNNPESGQ